MRFPQAGRQVPTYAIPCVARGNHLAAQNDEPDRLTEADRALAAQFAGESDDLVLNQGFIGGLPA